ncbi:MAG TPA: hypothetical protein VGG64_00730 [Pirellulales bacterium]
MKRAILFIACLALFVAARGQPSYPIKLQPGIWPPEKGVVVSSTPPRSYGYASCWFYALNDLYNPAAATVYVDYLRVYALVNGKTVLVNNSDYGTGAGKQPTAAGDWTIRYNAADNTTLIDEIPGVVADGWAADYLITKPTNHPTYATQLWNDVPQQIPAHASKVWVEARLLVQGSAVCEIGIDWYNSQGVYGGNGSFSGFQIFASPNWQVVDFGK